MVTRTFRSRAGEYVRAVQEYDEWIKTLPGGKKVRYSYQLLTTGFSASAEILAVNATMVYTHTHTDHPLPPDRAQIEVEFTEDLSIRPERIAGAGRVNEALARDSRGEVRLVF